MMTFDSRQLPLPLNPRLSHTFLCPYTDRILHHHKYHTWRLLDYLPQLPPNTQDQTRRLLPYLRLKMPCGQTPHLTYTRPMLTFDSRQLPLPLSPRLSHPSMYTHTHRISHHHSHHTWRLLQYLPHLPKIAQDQTRCLLPHLRLKMPCGQTRLLTYTRPMPMFDSR